MKRIWILLILICALASVTGCVSGHQYRTDLRVQHFDTNAGFSGSSIIETTDNYTLGFVEFDDQGWLRNRNQIDAITNRFCSELKTNSLVIITFVHGWMHNASQNDANLEMFRGVLDRSARLEEKLSKMQRRPPRRVVGVYAGWRGISSDVPFFKYITFWDRKSAAERIGHGSMTQLFLELEKVRNVSNRAYQRVIAQGERLRTRLFIIGHSFGGDIVYSAVEPILMERMIQNSDESDNAGPKSVGDMVALINPAIEAARFQTIFEIASEKQYFNCQTCVLAVFTSKMDLATKVAFPAGRLISTSLQSHRDHQQYESNKTAVGHYEPYVSFDLLPLQDSATTKNTEPDQAIENLDHVFGRYQLKHRKAHVPSGPFFVVSVDPSILKDHGAFDQKVFVRVVADFMCSFLEKDVYQTQFDFQPDNSSKAR